MDDLISRKDVLYAISVLRDNKYGNIHFRNGIANAMSIVEYAPAVETTAEWISVKERSPDVVRCKECKHGENNCYVNGLTLCKRPIYGEVDGTVNTLMAESDFCSYGERK